jgi:hypothetical protein
MERDIRNFSIDRLLDELYKLRTMPLDSNDWKSQQASKRAVIVAELETRSKKDLVQALIREALR